MYLEKAPNANNVEYTEVVPCSRINESKIGSFMAFLYFFSELKSECIANGNSGT